ncbi:LCP family protein [Sporosarcina sp.]|uniref:LCP family glycopolymer transferase n=1 Tax=Sporosarcina sp. TaxID=49982 RepID=UPI002612808B|nr:LCP family protein [Sporosarcina sp.]
MAGSTDKKKRKWFWILCGIGIIVATVLIYGVMLYIELTRTVQEIHEPIKREPQVKRTEAIALNELNPFSVLVLGVDERAGDAGRSDTMIVLTINPRLNGMKMVSIPRDTYTEIIGKDIKDKINHAFSFGGIEMAMDSVENFLDIPIDYVVQVNMESFKDIVDAVGGIKIKNTLDFEIEGHHFPVGDLSMNGADALAFVRMRYDDPNGDFGRQDRQKYVIQEVLKKGASLKSLVNYRNIFSSIENNVRTNMTFEDMKELQANYKETVNHIDQLVFKDGEGMKINGVWYYVMNDTELETMRNELKVHLEL